MSGLDSLKQKLNAYIRAFYGQRVLRGLIFWVGLSLVSYLLLSLVEYLGRFPSAVRAVFFWSYLALFLSWLSIFVVLPLLRMLKVVKGLDYQSAATDIGRKLPGFDHKILDALSLDLAAENKELLEAALDQKLAQFRDVDFKALLPWQDLKRLSLLFLIPLVIIGALSQWEAGRDILYSSERLVYYNEDFLPPAPFDFILPDNQEVIYGEDVLLEISLRGSQIPNSIKAAANGVELFPVKTGPGTWTLKLEQLKEATQLHFQAMEYKSRYVEIDIIQRPSIAGLSLRVTPPRYTGIKEELTTLSGVHRFPEGSAVSMQLLNGTNLEEAALVLKDAVIPFEADQANFILDETLDFGLRIANAKVNTQLYQGSRIIAIKDQRPEIEVTNLDTSSSTESLISIAFADDYGIIKLERILHLDQKDINQTIRRSANGRVTDRLVLDSVMKEAKNLSVSYRVWDNDGINGSKSSQTERIALSLLSAEDNLSKQINDLQSQSSFSEERSKDQKKLDEKLSALQRDMVDQKRLDWNTKQDLKEQLDELNKQRKQSIEKRKELKENLEKLEEDSQQAKELEKRLDEMNKEEDRLRALEEEIRELMEQLNMNELKQKLEELQQENQEQMRRDERMDDLLEDLLFQRDLLKEAERLDKLSKFLEEQSQKEESDLAKTEQNQKDLQEAIEKLEDLAKENSQLQELMNSEEFSEQKEKAENSLNEAKEQKQNKQSDQANQSEKNASESTQEMSESLTAMMMQMQSQALQMNMETIRRILENLKQFSKDVEASGLAIGDLGKEDPRYRFLLTEQSRLLAGAQVIEDSLVVLAAKAPQVQEKVFKELRKMMQSLELGRGRLQEQDKVQASVQHQYSMMAANELALLLDNSLQNMMSMMAMQQKGNQNCEKPGGAKPKPGQMSEKLSQMGEMVQKLQKGSKEGQGKEGQGSREMAKIMSEQEALRQMIKDAESEQEGAGGNGDKDTDKLLEELDRLEDDLLDRDFDAYQERMKRIETRMLEHEKALEERQQKEEREASQAKNQLMEGGSALDEESKLGGKDAFRRSRLRLIPFYNTLRNGSN